MSARSSQPVWRKALSAVVAAAAIAGLGACQARNAADVTGSIDGSAAGAGSTAETRRYAEELGRRLDANPADPETALAYGRALRSLGQTAQSLAVLQQAALRNGDNLAVLAAYGRVLADSGRLKEAADVLSRAHRPERPDWRILSVQGAVADQMGDFQSAQRYYEAALRIAPGEPSIQSNQGLSFALAKRLPEAERILKEAALHPRADARVRQNLALVLGLQGRSAEAEAVLKRDLPAKQAAESAAGIRRMVNQTNSWKALKAVPSAGAAALPNGTKSEDRQAAL